MALRESKQISKNEKPKINPRQMKLQNQANNKSNNGIYTHTYIYIYIYIHTHTHEQSENSPTNIKYSRLI